MLGQRRGIGTTLLTEDEAMSRKQIILTFLTAMTVYVLAVFLWPSNITPSSQPGSEKGARLAGLSSEDDFRQERFGVPSPEQTETRIQ